MNELEKLVIRIQVTLENYGKRLDFLEKSVWTVAASAIAIIIAYILKKIGLI